jgi:DNA polymerase III alpha subunit
VPGLPAHLAGCPACREDVEPGRILLPKFPTPNDRDAFDYIVELTEKGLQKRHDTTTDELIERLKFELKTIKEMGFADYFLIVWDFIAFAACHVKGASDVLLALSSGKTAVDSALPFSVG